MNPTLELRAHPWRGLLWLSARECLRVSRVWTQTMLAPIVSSILFIVVFGLSLGGRIRDVSGFPYEEFIVPGLIAMAMAQAAYSNSATSIFLARWERYIDDVLAAPMHAWQVHLGYVIGGAFRALVIGLALAALAVPLTGVPVENPLALAGALLLLVAMFGALGAVVGIVADSYDRNTFVNNIVIVPLTFMGGVFYSVDLLPSPWAELSHANPIFYMVNAVRFGFLGTSDVSPVLCIAVTAVLAGAFLAWSQWLFATGRRLKP